MDFSSYFPIWNKLTPTQQQILEQNAVLRKVDKGTVIHNGTVECTGLLLVRSGQLRAYILSDEGREISLYRLFDRDICLFSASCMMNSIQFEITIEAQKDTTMWVISADTYQHIMKESAVVANFTNEIMATRFSEVMWLMEQIMWKSFDKRLAGFLLEECSLEGTNILKITHETIAGHMGTAREVVTRMLRYFQNEGMVRLARGTVEVTDKIRLEQLQNDSAKRTSACYWLQADVLILCSIHSTGRSRFNETAIIGYSVIEPEAAGEVIAVKSVSGQDATGNVAAQAAMANDVDRLMLVQFIQPLSQLVHRDIKEAVNVSVCEFFHSAGV